MSIALTLLAEVRWRGRPVAGDRPQALLAALAARDCRPVRPEELIELVWGDDAPSNGLKSLQVLASRARNACGADAIVLHRCVTRVGWWLAGLPGCAGGLGGGLGVPEPGGGGAGFGDECVDDVAEAAVGACGALACG